MCFWGRGGPRIERVGLSNQKVFLSSRKRATLVTQILLFLLPLIGLKGVFRLQLTMFLVCQFSQLLLSRRSSLCAANEWSLFSRRPEDIISQQRCGAVTSTVLSSLSTPSPPHTTPPPPPSLTYCVCRVCSSLNQGQSVCLSLTVCLLPCDKMWRLTAK